MLKRNEIIQFLQESCPNVWSTLNQKARRKPPAGFRAFLAGSWYEQGRAFLQHADKRINQLIEQTSEKLVGDTYRRDLSGADSEKKLAELLCEISLVASLARISLEVPVLRPKNESGTECDVKVVIEGIDLYGDSKRLEDRWEGGIRSVEKSSPGSEPTDSARPRSMDLYSKLKDVPRQFPSGTVNAVFLFHPSIWNSQLYIAQALFGDNSISSELGKLALYNDGLYSLPEWRKISACCHSRVDYDGTLSIVNIWKNPNAPICVPYEIVIKLQEAF
jgi:hypothetical protein